MNSFPYRGSKLIYFSDELPCVSKMCVSQPAPNFRMSQNLTSFSCAVAKLMLSRWFHVTRLGVDFVLIRLMCWLALARTSHSMMLLSCEVVTRTYSSELRQASEETYL